MNVTPNDVLRFALALAGIGAAGYWGTSSGDVRREAVLTYRIGAR